MVLHLDGRKIRSAAEKKEQRFSVAENRGRKRGAFRHSPRAGDRKNPVIGRRSRCRWSHSLPLPRSQKQQQPAAPIVERKKKNRRAGPGLGPGQVDPKVA